jgi:malate dehydrogenase (quinone)
LPFVYFTLYDYHMPNQPTDVVLIGTGIMSATLGVLLHRLQPDWRFEIFERLDQIAAESSDAWNNAGTGHAAYCELNYTTEKTDGSVDCSKAFKINDQFELSKQFWAYLTEQGILDNPGHFIHSVPHFSFVQGADNVAFLKKRHAALTGNYMFKTMEFTDDPAQLAAWLPLMMDHRDPAEPVAATRMNRGVDVNFGALTRGMFRHFDRQPHTDIYLRHEVVDIQRHPESGYWNVTVEDLSTGAKRTVHSRFVFIGAGGGALDLLNKSDIPEADGYGGFPVSGQWLRCTNEAVIARHHAKVYGKASVGSPPMSVPHLDTRVIDGKKELLFGPFAGFSTKFLKEGSYLDLFKSIDADNLLPMIQAGWDNIPLTRYLIGQIMQSPEDRLAALRAFYPDARAEDWELKIAGQRVQVIRKDDEKGGVLEFGTEVVHAVDGSLAALLGASPGASTAVAAMLDILDRCFPKPMSTEKWQKKLVEMIPSYGQKLSADALLCARVKNWTGRVLELDQ